MARYINTNQLLYQTSVIDELNLLFWRLWLTFRVDLSSSEFKMAPTPLTRSDPKWIGVEFNTNVRTKQTQLLHTNNISNKACTLTTNCFTNAEQKPVLALSLFYFDGFSTLNWSSYAKLWLVAMWRHTVIDDSVTDKYLKIIEMPSPSCSFHISSTCWLVLGLGVGGGGWNREHVTW